jgi:hypothetical protein
MLTEADITQFYLDVAGLGLKFPVAAIAKATKLSKGNVSDYLNRRKKPSENFLKRFYEAFPKSTQKVPEITDQLKPQEFESLLAQLIRQQNALMEKQNEILAEHKEEIKDKVKNIESSLGGVYQNQQVALTRQHVGLEVLFEALTGEQKGAQSKELMEMWRTRSMKLIKKQTDTQSGAGK